MGLDVSNASTARQLNFNQHKNIKINDNESFTHRRENAVKTDIYSKSPVRLLGFTNEVGAALSPIIGPVGELVSYAPALSYIFMDVRDKYNRGDDDTYQNKSKKRAGEQLIFQTLASVILPTAAVKTSQATANKIIDSKALKTPKDSLVNWVNQKQGLSKFIQKFADKADHGTAKRPLTKFALGFQKALNVITVFPLFFKQSNNKSGLRNIGLAAVGLTTLAFVIKPIDTFVEHVVIGKLLKHQSNKNEKS